MGKSKGHDRKTSLKDEEYSKKEKKIHRVEAEFRTNVKQTLKKVLRGELTEDEFEEAYGENEEI